MELRSVNTACKTLTQKLLGYVILEHMRQGYSRVLLGNGVALYFDCFLCPRNGHAPIYIPEWQREPGCGLRKQQFHPKRMTADGPVSQFLNQTTARSNNTTQLSVTTRAENIAW
jgi:hypothetical protein